MDYKEKALSLQRMSNCKAVLKEQNCSKKRFVYMCIIRINVYYKRGEQKRNGRPRINKRNENLIPFKDGRKLAYERRQGSS